MATVPTHSGPEAARPSLRSRFPKVALVTPQGRALLRVLIIAVCILNAAIGAVSVCYAFVARSDSEDMTSVLTVVCPNVVAYMLVGIGVLRRRWRLTAIGVSIMVVTSIILVIIVYRESEREGPFRAPAQPVAERPERPTALNPEPRTL
jgi:hypothetical protein